MRNPSSTPFNLLGTIALTCVIVPANLYAQGHREHFYLYMRVGNADRQLIGSVATQLIYNDNGASNRQTRHTLIGINPGWRWLTNRGYVGEHEDISSDKGKVTWAKSPSRFYRSDSRYRASLIDFTTETHNAGATSFALRYSGNHHIGTIGGDYIYTYRMSEEGYSQPCSNDEPDATNQVESPDDLDEGYNSLNSLEDLGATALDPDKVTVTSARLSIIDLYHRNGSYERFGSWYFNHYFDDSPPDWYPGMDFDFDPDLDQFLGLTPDFNQTLNLVLDFDPGFNMELASDSSEERDQQVDDRNHQPATEQSDQPASEPQKNVFFDIWSLFENRMLVHRLIADDRYSVFLVSPHLGTNPVMLSNSGLAQQGDNFTFNLLSALQDPLGGRPVVGSIHLVASSSATLERIQIEFTTNTNKNVQIELVREPPPRALTEVLPVSTPEPGGQGPSPVNDLECDEVLEDSSLDLPEPEWFQNLGAHQWFQFLNGDK